MQSTRGRCEFNESSPPCLRRKEKTSHRQPPSNTVKKDDHAETKSMYIHLADSVSADTEEVCEGVTVDFDADGKIVGIGIDNTDVIPGFNPPLELVATNT